MGRPPRSRHHATRTPLKSRSSGRRKRAPGSSMAMGERGSGPGDAPRAAARRPRRCAPSAPRRRAATSRARSARGHAPRRGPEADDIAEARRVAERAAQCRCRRRWAPSPQASATAAPPLLPPHVLVEVVRVQRRAEDRVERLRAGAELRRIGLADGDRAGGLDALDDERVVVGHVVLVDRRAERRADALVGTRSLCAIGQAVERAERLAARERLVGGARLRAAPVGDERHDRVDLRVDALDLGEVRLQHLGHRGAAGADQLAELGCGQEAEVTRARRSIARRVYKKSGPRFEDQVERRLRRAA